ncbi:MAG: 3-keto-5-aminohexanoate cleavage protein [Deltaproteobacteria bacterium]|nr:3-keto-5-aminohexanoate cleavage protein [Deltaproteobacteria bacterium]
MSDKVIVTCALTGVLATREQCPWVPYTPSEIADEAKRAYDAGASGVPIHARTDEGGPTFEPAVYQAIKDETARRCPIIINFSTGGAGPMTERVAHIAQSKPDIGALNMGSMNYAKYSPRRKEFVFDFVFENPFRDISFLLGVMKEAGVKPELECFDIGHTNSIGPLVDKGLLKLPLTFSFIMGVLGGVRATTENLAMQAREAQALAPGSQWEVIGISHEQWKMVSAALTLGGNVRVGLEDNFYLDAYGKEMAKSNGDLVAKAVRMARDIGREPATVEEARKMLSLDSVW